MSTKSFKYKPVIPGFPWEAIFRIQSKIPFFDSSASYRADVRVNENSPLLATISTDNGGIEVLDGQRVKVTLTGLQSALMRQGGITFDFIRTDGLAPVHTGLRAHVRVNKSVTVAHAAG